MFHKNEWPTYIQIPCARKEQHLFCKRPLWFYQRVIWNWYHQHARVLIDNIFCLFGERVFQRTFGIRLGTICAPLLADLFLYSYEVDFILLQKNENKLARSFNFTFRYIDDVLSLNNSRFGDFIDRIYPIELEIKDTTDTDRSASYLDLHLDIDSEGRLRTKLYDKGDVSIFPLWTFHLYVATFQQHLHMEHISLSWYDIPEHMVPVRISLIEGCCLHGS